MMTVYDDCLSNEIYRVELGKSKLFSVFAGRTFDEAYTETLPKEACLIGIMSRADGLLLNPPKHRLLVCAVLCCPALTAAGRHRHLLLRVAHTRGLHGH